MRYAERVAGPHDQTGGAVQERVRTRQQTPKQYNVVLLNDDGRYDDAAKLMDWAFQNTN